MRTTRIVSGFVSWRWMPFCALVAGSLLYVGLVVLFVPSNLGKLPATQVSTPLDPGSDALTASALGRTPSRSSHRASSLGLPARKLAGSALGGRAPAPGPTHMVESRAEALGAPPPRPAPPPTAEPAVDEHVAPQLPHEEPAAPPTPAPPHEVVQHRLFGGLHMIAPRVAPPTVETVPQVENRGGAANDDGAGSGGAANDSAGSGGSAGNEK